MFPGVKIKGANIYQKWIKIKLVSQYLDLLFVTSVNLSF